MVVVKKLVLDILKPHQPNALDFAKEIASAGLEYHVHLTVIEVDKATETIQIVIEGKAIDYEAITTCIGKLGGSLHSIDEVVVENQEGTG